MSIRSNRTRHGAGLAAVLVAAMGCQSTTDVQVTDLQGTWVASEVRIVDLELPKENNFDLVELGYSAVFVSPGTGEFTIRLEPPEGESEYIVGTMEIDGTDVVVTTDETVGSGEVFFEDDQAALSITAGLTYDFGGKGEEKPAKLLLVMDRQSPEPTPL
jgi:hypothetical protein